MSMFLFIFLNTKKRVLLEKIHLGVKKNSIDMYVGKP